MIIPLIFLIICFVLIFSFGIKKGIDLSGGTSLTIYTNENYSTEEIKLHLKNTFNLEDVSVIFSKGVEVNRLDIQYLQEEKLVNLQTQIKKIKDMSVKSQAIEKAREMLLEYNYDLDALNLKEYADWMKSLNLIYNDQKNVRTQEILTSLKTNFNVDTESVTIKEISPTLGASFTSKAILVGIIALIGIIIVVLLAFREIIPAGVIIVCGIIDIIGGLVGLAVLNIPLSLTTIPVLLMLFGYSIDTDIMLTTKLLKRSEGNSRERAGDAFKTGTIMTTTTLCALIIMVIFAFLYNVSVIYEIAIVLLFGLIADILTTWFMNAPILLWYVGSKKK